MFHVLAALARPPDPTPVSGDKKGSGAARSTPRGLLRDIMKQAMAMSRTPPSLSSMGEWQSTLLYSYFFLFRNDKPCKK